MQSGIQKNSEIELDIEKLAFGGQGVARIDGYVIFLAGVLPGQKVKAKITRKKKKYAEAKVLEILAPAPEQVSARCPHFGECGGCRFQDLDYPAQIKYKQQQVVESLEHIGGLEAPDVLPTVPSPEQYYYRNKMEYSFGRQRWLTQHEIRTDEITRPKDFALGLHVRGRFDKILDLDTCYLQSPRSVEILQAVRAFVLHSNVPAYTTRDHSGFWRHLVVREGKNTGESMVNLVTADVPEYFSLADELGRILQARFLDLTTVVHNINRKKAEVALGDAQRVLHGPGFIREKIGSCLFQVSANSFFQTNTKGAEILYNKVIELGQFNRDEIVYDLYSGAGTISLYLAEKVKRVVGFEIVAQAVQDAEMNQRLNGAENCLFQQGDLRDLLADPAECVARFGRPDSMIIDPPRVGMHAEVLERVRQLRPHKIVYVSCNPATFSRDAKALCESEYKLGVVQPVDMFPHTAHVELVSLMTREHSE